MHPDLVGGRGTRIIPRTPSTGADKPEEAVEQDWNGQHGKPLDCLLLEAANPELPTRALAVAIYSETLDDRSLLDAPIRVPHFWFLPATIQARHSRKQQ